MSETPGQFQDLVLYLLQVRAQRVHGARAVAFGGCTWLLAHDLGDGTSVRARSLAKRRKRTAQARVVSPAAPALLRAFP